MERGQAIPQEVLGAEARGRLRLMLLELALKETIITRRIVIIEVCHSNDNTNNDNGNNHNV